MLRLPRPWNPAFQETYDAMTPRERHRSALFDLMVLIVGLMIILIGSSASAQTFPERGRAAVVDAAGVIPDAEERALNERIVRWVNANGPQLAVVTVPSLEGRDVKDYANRLFRHWGLGQGSGSSAESNGVLLLLAPTERKVRIEVGYGLEPVLTDALTGQIIRERVVPGLKANQIPQALSAGADAIMEAATPTAENPAPVVQPTGQSSLWKWLLGGFLLAGAGFAFVVWRVSRTRQRYYDEMLERQRERARERTVAPAPSGFSFADIPPSPRRSADPVRHTRPAASYSPPPPPPPSRRRDDDDYSSRSSYSSYGSSSSSDYGSSSSSSSSYDSGSSSSGYDSGGGSSGGGGSDSSY